MKKDKFIFIIIAIILVTFNSACSRHNKKENGILTNNEFVKRLIKNKSPSDSIWIEAEKREVIYIRYVYQDKSGSVGKLEHNPKITNKIITDYFLYKLKKPNKLYYWEKEVLFYEAGQYSVRDITPLVLDALKEEKMANPHIAAALYFKKLKIKEALPQLKLYTDINFRKTLSIGDFDVDSKLEELLEISLKAIKEIE